MTDDLTPTNDRRVTSAEVGLKSYAHWKGVNVDDDTVVDLIIDLCHLIAARECAEAEELGYKPLTGAQQVNRTENEVRRALRHFKQEVKNG